MMQVALNETNSPIFDYIVSKIEFVLNKEDAIKQWQGIDPPEVEEIRAGSRRRLLKSEQDCRTPKKGTKAKKTCRKFKNKAYYGGLMKVVKSITNPDDCCSKCVRTRNCVSWTLKPKSVGKGRGCYLRKSGKKRTGTKQGYWSGYIGDARAPNRVPSSPPPPPPEEVYNPPYMPSDTYSPNGDEVVYNPPNLGSEPYNPPDAYQIPDDVDQWLQDQLNNAPKPPTTPSPSIFDFGPTDSPNLPPGTGKYKELLDLNWMFYEAQRSGPEPSWNRIDWRGSSHLNDPVVGGLYDAGDTLKLNFPMAATMVHSGFGLVEFPRAYSGDRKAKALRVYRIAIQYLYDCLDVEAGTYIGQIGDPKIDHNYWGRPEEQNLKRPAFVYKKDTMNAPDLYGGVAAALAQASVVFKNAGDSGFASKLIAAAKELYSWGDGKPGKYSNYFKDQTKIYRSSGGDDSMAAAAGWLYRATGDRSWLDKALKYWDYDSADVYAGWDSLWGAHAVHMVSLADKGESIPGEAEYRRYLDNKFWRAWLKADGYQSIIKSPRGMHYPKWNAWANLQFSTTTASLALINAKYTKDSNKKSSLKNYAKSQVDYAIGGNGFRSYVIGWGYKYPKFEHHAPASCPDLPAPCGKAQFSSSDPNPQILYGAMVAGPGGVRRNRDKPDEAYSDKRDDYVTNEVALDYNGGLGTALAGLVELF